MKLKNILRIVLVVGVLLLIPLVFAFDWTLVDFVVMGVLLFVTGITLSYLAVKIKRPTNRIVAIIATIIMFLLVWAELSVGIFNNPFSGS